MLLRDTGGALVPQSPPWAMNRSYLSRPISSVHAFAMRWISQPASADVPLNPYPGSEGMTT